MSTAAAKPRSGGRLNSTEASLAIDRLEHFVKAAWPIVVPSHPLVWGWHIEAICEHLEAVSRGWISHLVMNVPPRHMKSLTTSVFWPAWEWVKRPELHYLSVSHSAPLAGRDARKTRLLMQSTGLGRPESDLWALNEGRRPTVLQRIGYRGLLEAAGNPWEFAGDQNLKWRYENDRRGARIATSIGGGGTGEGGHRIIIDDPHKLEEWDSETKRKEAIEFATEIAPTRRNTKDAALVMIMQRVHEEDATSAVLGELDDVEGWGDEVVHLCLPEEYEVDHQFVCPAEVEIPWATEPDPDDPQERRPVPEATVKGDPRTVDGELLWPEFYGPKQVAEHKGVGPLRYAGNYRQLPAPVEGNVYLKADWRYYGHGGDREDLPPTWERVLCSWDLTFGESDDPGASYVAGQCWGKDGAQVYLLAEIFARMSFPEMKDAVRALRDFAPVDQAGGKGMILVEQKAAGKPLIEELQTEIPAIVPVEPHMTKLARAVAVQPYQGAGNVYLPKGTIPAPAGYEERPTREFVNTLAMFPAAKSDDEVDTLSQALQELYHSRTDEVLSISMRQDAEPVMERHGIRKVGARYVDKE